MNISFMKRGLWAMALLLTFTGSVMAQEVAPADPLALDAKAIKDAGIVLDKVAVRSLADELKAPGEVKVDAYSTVLVSPRVESQVLARKATLGDVVKMGQPLVVLSSVQVAETQGALIVAEPTEAIGPRRPPVPNGTTSQKHRCSSAKSPVRIRPSSSSRKGSYPRPTSHCRMFRPASRVSRRV